MSQFRLQWVITELDQGKQIKDFLKEREISKNALTDIKFAGGFITVNKLEVTVRYTLKTGDSLVVEFPEEKPSEGLIAEDLSLDILYEDPYILVINKPAGMSTIPSREHQSGSLANGLIGYYQQIGLQATVHIVTRLDRDTSGIVLVAKHRHVHHLFSKQQQLTHGVSRIYAAMAEGVFTEDRGTIEEPIARNKDSIIQREVNENGKSACTHFEIITRKDTFTYVKLRLETGRTHQIRVHLSYLGHPLLGDDLYGGKMALIKRQALHCCELSFYHPLLEKTLKFHQSLPDDMKQLLIY